MAEISQTQYGDTIRAGMAESRSRQLKTRSLIDSAFPTQGTAQPSHMGSQSSAPDKMSDQYSDSHDSLNDYTSRPIGPM